MIFIGALSMTFFAIAPSTCAALTMPTGALRREKMPPSDAVTIAASAAALRITSAPRSMRSPRSISGAGRMTSRTLVWSSTSNEETTASRPMVPSTSSPRTTTSGTGSCRRSTSSTSDSVSSGSHSAPSGEAMLSSSGMDGLAPHEREIGELPRRHHADHRLVLVRDDREAALVIAPSARRPRSDADARRRAAATGAACCAPARSSTADAPRNRCRTRRCRRR